MKRAGPLKDERWVRAQEPRAAPASVARFERLLSKLVVRRPYLTIFLFAEPLLESATTASAADAAPGD
jgi:hypothetical protein